LYPQYNKYSTIALAVSLNAITSGNQKAQMRFSGDLLTDLSNRADELSNEIFDARPDNLNGNPYRQWEKQTAEAIRNILMQARDILRSRSLPEEWRQRGSYVR
jgi:hypothetical protein